MFNVSGKEIYVCNEAFKRFIGTGLYVGLFFMAIIYIIYTIKKDDKKGRKIKIVLGVFSIIILVLNLNPLFTKLLTRILSETDTYWRVYWILPIGISIAFMFTDMILKKEKVSEKIAIIFLILGCIFLSGKYMYNSDDTEKFIKVNNYYKVPDNILDIIQHISEDSNDYKKLAGLNEFAVYTRQIDGNIILSEGRDMYSSYNENSIVTLINNNDLKAICDYCTNKTCNYLVVYKSIEFPKEYMLGYDIKKMYENDEYALYKFNRILSENN